MYNKKPAIFKEARLSKALRLIGSMSLILVSTTACQKTDTIVSDVSAVDTVAKGSMEQSHYGEVPATIPGIIEAEHYDVGGPGVAFLDLTTAGEGHNGDKACERGDNVFITTAGPEDDGCVVAWTQSGEWLEYSVNVVETGTYAIAFRVAHGFAGEKGAERGTFKLKQVVGGDAFVDLTENLAVPFTDDWQEYQVLEIDNVQLSSGPTVLRLFFTSNGGAGVYTPGNIDSMTFNLMR